MSAHREWYHGVLEGKFLTVHRGWRVIVQKSPFGWHWWIARCTTTVGGIENSRPAAEAAAFAAVDRREVQQ